MDDITAMEMDASGIVSAMISGSLDACALWSPSTLAVSTELGDDVVKLADNLSFADQSASVSSWICMSKYADEKSDVLLRYVKALYKAKDYRADPANAEQISHWIAEMCIRDRFWTQYMGIDALVFAGLLVVLKIWDAINDPLIGSLMDSSTKQYKEGKFKHFISIGAIGLVVAAALCFLPLPGAPYMVKVILCLLGYMAWDACYTIVNVPYGSMLSVITADAGDRAQLGAWRTLGSLAASLPMGIILPIVLYDENQNIMGVRLFIAALLLGVVAWFAFHFMVKTTVQRVQVPPPSPDAPKFNFLVSIKNFVHNRPALGATLQPVAMFLGTYGAGTAATVMFQSYFKNMAISGLMMIISMLPMVLFIPFVKKITVKWGKQEGSCFGLLFSIAACALMVVVPIPPNGTGVAIYMGLMLLNGLGMGVSICVGNACLLYTSRCV